MNRQIVKLHIHGTGKLNKFTMKCYNNHFTTVVKNNKAIYSNDNGVHIPGQFVPKLTSQIENMSI